MPFELAVWTLLHILVFVYWLGGDLGAFYASRFLTLPNVSAEKRLLAGKIVADVDMAPRTALILAIPTGYILAIRSGWIAAPVWTAVLLFAAGFLWLAMAWKIHMSHGAGVEGYRKIDLAIRYIVIVGLVTLAIAGLAGVLELPRFIAIKFLLLASAIFMGLLIRGVLKPLGPALAGLTGEDSAKAEADVARTLQAVKPYVTMIWVLIILAAFTGLLKP